MRKDMVVECRKPFNKRGPPLVEQGIKVGITGSNSESPNAFPAIETKDFSNSVVHCRIATIHVSRGKLFYVSSISEIWHTRCVKEMHEDSFTGSRVSII